jgi:hypothetical protein
VFQKCSPENTETYEEGSSRSGDICIMRNCEYLTKQYWEDQITEKEMGGACSKHGREAKFILNVGSRNL